ncbi:MAG: hypothetical protein H7289_10020, partial [Mucilaginibacter sp.]|nr:hypothetical protein [Mucilaginibacter sp.]
MNQVKPDTMPVSNKLKAIGFLLIASAIILNVNNASAQSGVNLKGFNKTSGVVVK